MSPRHESPAAQALSQRCSARAKRTGERCRSRAILGATVCRLHGANSAVRRKAADRVALAEALGTAERRAPWEVLAHALHVADVLGRDALAEVQGGTVTPETVGRLVDSVERAGRFAKTALEAGVDERQTQLAESQGALLVSMLRRVEARLGLSPAQARLWPQIVSEELRVIAAAEQS